MKYKSFYSRNLPHYHPEGYSFFVTFRLAGSLPINIVNQLKEEREKEISKISGYINIKIRNEKYRNIQTLYFGKFDKLLDSAYYGPQWLKNKNVLLAIKDEINHLDNKLYSLICYSIMPNHVHMVFTPNTEKIQNTFNSVTKILQQLKSKTAIISNKIVNRSGPFWQHESYDHAVRDEKELIRIINYVLNNPVKAKLCEEREDWIGNYCNMEKIPQY